MQIHCNHATKMVLVVPSPNPPLRLVLKTYQLLVQVGLGLEIFRQIHLHHRGHLEIHKGLYCNSIVCFSEVLELLFQDSHKHIKIKKMIQLPSEIFFYTEELSYIDYRNVLCSNGFCPMFELTSTTSKTSATSCEQTNTCLSTQFAKIIMFLWATLNIISL